MGTIKSAAMVKRLEKQKKKLEAAKKLLDANGFKVHTPAATGRTTEYKPEFCERLIEHMGKGLSFECFSAVIKVVPQTIYNWLEKYPEFLEAKQIGANECLLFWESLGVSGSTGHLPGFNASAYKFNKQNRFGWTDRQDVTSGGSKISPPQVHIMLPANGREAVKVTQTQDAPSISGAQVYGKEPKK